MFVRPLFFILLFSLPSWFFILICEMALGFRVSRQEEVEEKKLSFAESSCWSSSFIAPWREIKRSVFWLLSALLCWQNVKRCRDFKRMQQFENCALASSFFITIQTRVRRSRARFRVQFPLLSGERGTTIQIELRPVS